jgi:phage shock protein A
VAEEDLQEPTAEFVLTGSEGDDLSSTDSDDEWSPSDNLELTYNDLLHALRMVRRSVSDTASAREVVEYQIQQLARRAEDPEGSLGSVRAAIDEQIADLKTQLALIGARVENLASISEHFQTDVERFRTEKELLKASYSAVEALTVMGDAVGTTTSPDSTPRTA